MEMETKGLILYQAAKRALAEIHKIDEVKNIADKAQAMKAYAHQAQNLDLERMAAEVRLRAKRRLGELSRLLPTAQGSRRDIKTFPAVGESIKTDILKGAGVSQAEAHRCEQLAKIPEERFAAYLEECNEKDAIASSDEITRLFPSLGKRHAEVLKDARVHNARPIALNEVYLGDCRDGLRAMNAEGLCAQMCVTSPPYWGLRDYRVNGQLGHEATLEEYVSTLVDVFRLVRDVLADDGTLWLVLGDTYLKTKDMAGIPWRVALALQANGWYLRSDTIWHKPNPMPESIKDRPAKAHEYVFMLSKSAKYHYDIDMTREPHLPVTLTRIQKPLHHKHPGNVGIGIPPVSTERMGERFAHPMGRNLRSVWTIATEPFPDAHFATFPQKLVEPCIRAGSKPGDIVLDPFFGSGTVGVVAERLARQWIGIELNPDFIELSKQRVANG